MKANCYNGAFTTTSNLLRCPAAEPTLKVSAPFRPPALVLNSCAAACLHRTEIVYKFAKISAAARCRSASSTMPGSARRACRARQKTVTLYVRFHARKLKFALYPLSLFCDALSAPVCIYKHKSFHIPYIIISFPARCQELFFTRLLTLRRLYCIIKKNKGRQHYGY